MTIHFVQKDSNFEAGFINLHAGSFPSIAMNKKKGLKLNGLAFNSQESLKKAVRFLHSAYQELYGEDPLQSDGRVPSGAERSSVRSGENESGSEVRKQQTSP